MAGNYPDVPGKRLAYDRDGSQVWHYNNSTVTTQSQAIRQAMNSEALSTFPGLNGSGFSMGVIFPVLTTIRGSYLYCSGGAASGTFDYSTDTTTGVDGTWTNIRATHSFVVGSPVNPLYRTIYTTGLPVDAKALRWRQSGAGAFDVENLHLYGNRVAASNRLELWHPTLDQALYVTPALGDHGDQPRAVGNLDFSFRIKNLSATLTAQTITITPQELTPGSPTILSLTTVNYNGGAYGAAGAAISGPATLAPGAISPVCIMRTNITALAPIGLWNPRVVAAAATWV